MLKFNLIILATCLFSCSGREYKDPHVMIITGFGDIEVELYPGKAPKTVASFLSNIDAGLYDNSSFYRVLKSEEFPSDLNTGIIQGGLWQAKPGKQKGISGINHESTMLTGLSHTDGIISMARTDTGSATTEFFICIGDQSPLDHGRRGTLDGQGFSAFGKVFKGMNIVRKIQGQNSRGDSFDEKIKITAIKRL